MKRYLSLFVIIVLALFTGCAENTVLPKSEGPNQASNPMGNEIPAEKYHVSATPYDFDLMCVDFMDGVKITECQVDFKGLSSDEQEEYTITIPEALNGKPVRAVGEYSFYKLSKAVNVILPETLRVIEASAFFKGGISDFHIPSGVIEITGNIFEGNTCLKRITVSGDNTAFCAVDGVLFDKEITRLICRPYLCEGTSYTVPDGVTTIDDGAFFTDQLTEIVVPASVENFSEDAFLWGHPAEKITLIVVPGSSAEEFATAHGERFDFRYH